MGSVFKTIKFFKLSIIIILFGICILTYLFSSKAWLNFSAPRAISNITELNEGEIVIFNTIIEKTNFTTT